MLAERDDLVADERLIEQRDQCIRREHRRQRSRCARRCSDTGRKLRLLTVASLARVCRCGWLWPYQVALTLAE
jgi:hypothetical protein